MKALEKIKIKDWRVIVLDIFLIIASIVLAGKIVTLIEDVKYDIEMGTDESSFYYHLEDREYPYIVNYGAEALAEKKSGYNTVGMQECYAVGDYYEAASLYKAYLVTGDEERAARMKERMEEAEGSMGELSIEIPRILRQLGIEEE